jgi:hypothetical protein
MDRAALRQRNSRARQAMRMDIPPSNANARRRPFHMRRFL